MHNGQFLIGPKRSTTTDNFTVNIIGANPKTTNTGANPVASALLGGLASVFSAALITKASDTPRSSSTGGSTPAQQTPAQSQAQVLRAKIEAAEGQLAAQEANYTNLDQEKSNLTEATDENIISGKEGQLNELKEKLFDNDKTYKDDVQKVQNCEMKIENANNALTAAQQKVTGIDAEISDLEGKQKNCEALTKDPNCQDKDAANARLRELGENIAKKRKEKVEAESEVGKKQVELDSAKQEKAKLQEELNGKYTEIQTNLTNYNKLNKEVTTLRGQLTTNQARLKELNTTLPGLKSQIDALKGNIKSMKDQLIDIEGKEALDKQNAANKYAEADKKDGNWWKRNMPKWLGGSDKATRDSMKNAHRQKDAAGAQLESYGLDSSDYSLSNQAKQKATSLYDSLDASQKKKYKQSKAIKYFKENPTATFEQAKIALGL